MAEFRHLEYGLCAALETITMKRAIGYSSNMN